MGLRAEVWTRPGDANYGKVIDDPPTQGFSYHDPMNEVGDGSVRIPNTYDRFDEILKSDEATPANSVKSTVRVFDGATWVGDWFPSSLLPTTDKFDLNVDISGPSIKDALAWARVEAYDWDGSDDWVPSVPDWVYGGANLLQNPFFSASSNVPYIWELSIDATGGTYTISDGTDTTMAIAYDASAATIETRLQTDIASIGTGCIVTGTSAAPYLRTINVPTTSLTTISLTIDTASLTGGSGTLIQTQAGYLGFGPWESAHPLTLPATYDNYDSFGLSSIQAHSGNRSLLIQPGTVYPYSNRNGGLQQVVNVTPGQTYQAAIWIYPSSATDRFRLALFSTGEELLEATAPNGATLTANQWNELTLTDVVIPEGVTQIIFRTQVTNSTNTTYDPSDAWYDDAELLEGLAATTVGAIIGDLYDDATINHAGRVVWDDDANPGTPWLSLDFTDSVDSNGDAWVDSAISIKLWMRMTYLQVMDQFSRSYGYEWRIVPDSVSAGTYKLQLYNPGGMATDYSSASAPAIQGGSADVRRDVRRFLPSATNHLVEGLSRITAREDTVGLEAAIGRIEGSRIDRELPTQSAIADAAFQDAEDAMSNANAYVYELIDPQDTPMVDYIVGDILLIHDPPDVDDTARLIDIEIVSTPQATTYECQFFPTTAAGS